MSHFQLTRLASACAPFALFLSQNRTLSPILQFPMPSTMDQAIDSVERAELRSIRATALAYGVDRTTLTRRLNGGFQRTKGHTSQQLLSPGQEDILVTWVLEQERLGHAPTHQRVREYAAKISGYSGQGSYIGKNWLTRFMTRHPDVRTKIGRKIDYQRVENTQPEILKPWFDAFEALVDQYQVDSANIWNMDESGLGLGRCTNQQIVGGSKSGRTYVKSPETREWVTIIEVVSATGRALRPTVIFKGKDVQTS